MKSEATMKRTIVVAAFLGALLMSAGACRGCGTQCPRQPLPADAGTARSDGGPPLDAGPCNANHDAHACGCCFTAATVIVCPVGVAPPDAAVLTLPVCGGGQ